MRPLPTSTKGDGRPVFPALQKFGEAVGPREISRNLGWEGIKGMELRVVYCKWFVSGFRNNIHYVI